MLKIGLLIGSIAGVLQNYIDWLLNFLRVTGLSIGSLVLFLFIFWLVVNVVLSLLAEILPMIKRLISLFEYIFFPGSLMSVVWRIFVLKKLNIPTEQKVSFSWGWMRAAINVERSFQSTREAFLFFYAPFLNLLVIAIWIMPGILLFEWLDTLINGTVFYWIWIYVLISLVIMGLPGIVAMFAPLQVSVIKTPEFYLFVIFYVLIAPLTLILWGWGLTVIFSLLYAISAFYEIEKISRKEAQRLYLNWDKVFKKTEEKPTYLTLADEHQ
jgi:hypothetical protein